MSTRDTNLVSRRTFLHGAGALAAASAAASLIGCAPGATQPPGSGIASGPATEAPPSSGPVTLGSNHSDEVPRRALQDVVDAFTTTTGIDVRVNTVDHATFQNQLSNYLQGLPDDVFTWFAGYRMRFFAERGLTGDLSDLWAEIGDDFADGFRKAATAVDGREYFVPFYTYPWVILYRRSVWERAGYEPPVTFQELIALARRMADDGLVPIAFGDREGWPAMGYFDILNLRLNGYDFHVDLLEGRESWLDARVESVFERWRELLPFLQPAALGRTWQDAARSLFAGEAGMFFAGTFAGEQATPEQREDIELIPFPLLGTAFDDERAIDAPINGFMLSRQPTNRVAALEFLRFVASGPAQTLWTTANPNHVAAATDADRSHYRPLQRRAAELIDGAQRIAQFFDRNTRPDFAGQGGMQGYFQDFLTDPDRDLGAYLATIQEFWDSLG